MLLIAFILAMNLLMGVGKMDTRRYLYEECELSFDDLEEDRMVESYLNQDEITPREAAFLRGYYFEED